MTTATSKSRVNNIRLNGWAWRGGAGAVEPRRTDWGILPAGVSDMGFRVGDDKDITGAYSKGKRARAIGAGEDPEVKRARQEQEWRDCLDTAQAIEQRRGAMIDADATAARAELAIMEQELSDLQSARASIV